MFYYLQTFRAGISLAVFFSCLLLIALLHLCVAKKKKKYSSPSGRWMGDQLCDQLACGNYYIYCPLSL